MYDFADLLCSWNKAFLAQTAAASYLYEGVNRYNNDFLNPLEAASKTFKQLELIRFFERTPLENFQSYSQLYELNNDLIARYSQGTLEIFDLYMRGESERFFSAWLAALTGEEGKQLHTYFSHQEEILHRVLREYPKAILDIEPEYGFHFEDDKESFVAETDRFILRRVSPCKQGVKIDNELKPILIIPPFVLGANILSFLPGEEKSYAHSYANCSIPTYIRVMKDIQSTPAVQTMTLEEDVEDIRYFSEKIKETHGKKITLNGYCQGGFSSLCAILTGKLDHVVDALITCVAPMDGTRSKGLGIFLRDLPEQFNDLAYGTKTLENGNQIADGNLMGWIYKLKSIEDSGPMIAFIKDIMMLSDTGGNYLRINKTIAALNYWLQNERSDLPLSVTEMSFRSYNFPVTKDGTLPISIFGKKLNFHSINEKEINWLLCYGETDDLVEKEVALAPLDFVDVEVTPFPKGHVAIATSWSHPQSKCALHKVFGEKKYRGPVRFHLDLCNPK